MRPSKEQILAIVRHTLTFLGGMLITTGYSDDASVIMEIVGSATSLVGLIWSLFDKKKTTAEV